MWDFRTIVLLFGVFGANVAFSSRLIATARRGERDHMFD
jgi:hypothetical protein